MPTEWQKASTARAGFGSATQAILVSPNNLFLYTILSSYLCYVLSILSILRSYLYLYYLSTWDYKSWHAKTTHHMTSPWRHITFFSTFLTYICQLPHQYLYSYLPHLLLPCSFTSSFPYTPLLFRATSTVIASHFRSPRYITLFVGYCEGGSHSVVMVCA